MSGPIFEEDSLNRVLIDLDSSESTYGRNAANRTNGRTQVERFPSKLIDTTSNNTSKRMHDYWSSRSEDYVDSSTVVTDTGNEPE
ncbi:uncharacterized protein STEHIDRAFT_153981 [Stereum hirsutum FP-91666 SS1]|uniref:uncharacterized protein n=1 Tax=Stereum hirsutum (strain FP-91666) TaxID=721885 RepID=UPI000440E894|nr:uncharacterized protein STEHIDRAFT_153981 [Stereum hirsutum FP-91666 SS1]EIM90149.1 hypothetical protein STEHIDRAFT_153981 [Stereum hirsutum FP-91666 SS1]